MESCWVDMQERELKRHSIKVMDYLNLIFMRLEQGVSSSGPKLEDKYIDTMLIL